MAYTEVTRTSYGQRLGGSIKGIFVGLLLFIGGTALIWWNEGRAVKRDKLLKEAQGVVVEMPDISKVDPEFEGKFIHASGPAATDDILSDSKYDLSVNAVALRREVEYYQWVENSTTETKDKVGGAQETITTYTYEKEWTSSPVASSEFHDPAYRAKNSVKEQIESYVHYAQNVSFGAYRLNESQIRSISGWVPAELPGGSNEVYIGADRNAPEIGDVRVTFTKLLPGEVSILAAVSGDSFTSYKSKSGKTFAALRMGDVSQEEMFESEHQANKMLLWILRIVGFFVVLLGLRNMTGILETLFKVLPFLANIIGWGVGLVCALVAFVWTLLVAAIAWIAYRPVVGIVLLVIAGGAIWFFARRKKGAEVPPATPTPGV